jgi:hypothetical protein
MSEKALGAFEIPRLPAMMRVTMNRSGKVARLPRATREAVLPPATAGKTTFSLLGRTKESGRAPRGRQSHGWIGQKAFLQNEPIFRSKLDRFDVDINCCPPDYYTTRSVRREQIHH